MTKDPILCLPFFGLLTISDCFLTILKMWPLEYQKIIKTGSSGSSDTSDSSDSSDSSDNIDSSDSNDSSDSSDQTTLYTKKINLPKTYLPTYLCDSSYCRDSSDSNDSSDGSDSSDPQKNFTIFFSIRKLFKLPWAALEV